MFVTGGTELQQNRKRIVDKSRNRSCCKGSGSLAILAAIRRASEATVPSVTARFS
jgi:hypothetical protein